MNGAAIKWIVMFGVVASAAVLVVVAGGCDRSNASFGMPDDYVYPDEVANMLTLLTPPDSLDGYLTISGLSSAASPDAVWQLNAVILNPVTRLGGLDVGLVTICDLALKGRSLPESAGGYRYDQSCGAYSTLKPTIADVTVWSFTGNAAAGIPPLTDSLYVPDALHVLNPDQPHPAVSRTQGINIKWNADKNNSMGLLIGISPQFSESFPPPGGAFVRPWFAAVPDNGEFHIPAAAIAGMDLGDGVEITLRRGNRKIVKQTEQRFSLTALVTPRIEAVVVD